jgi:hypothetical protein
MDRLITGVHAPSTYGTFLPCFTFGHVRQLDSVAAAFLVNLTSCAPLLPGADQLAYLNLDDTVKATYGYAKQGTGYGYSGVKGLNALIAAVSTGRGAPLIVAARLGRISPMPQQTPCGGCDVRVAGRRASSSSAAPARNTHCADVPERSRS